MKTTEFHKKKKIFVKKRENLTIKIKLRISIKRSENTRHSRGINVNYMQTTPHKSSTTNTDDDRIDHKANEETELN